MLSGTETGEFFFTEFDETFSKIIFCIHIAIRTSRLYLVNHQNIELITIFLLYVAITL